MPKETFTIKYDGTALDNHEMDIAVLAPALMALGKLTQELSKAVSNGDYTATLSVKGNIKAGSIEVDLVTQPTLIQQIVGFLTSPSVTAVANLGGLVGLIAIVIDLIKKYKGKMPTSATDNGNDSVRLEFDGQIEVVNLYAYHAYTNYELRTYLYETLKPLEQQGIDSFEIKDKNKIALTSVESDDIGFFNPNYVVRSIGEQIQITTLVIESLTFKEKNKWSFNDGHNSIKAVILDNHFLNEIDNGKSFAKGDWLKVKLKTIQTEEAGKLKATYEIVEVLEHIVREQFKLDL